MAIHSKLTRLFNWGRPDSRPSREFALPRIEDANDDADWSWLLPPSNPDDVAGWDRYWTDHLKNGFGPPLFDMFYDDRDLVTVMNSQGMRRVLCVGNGISQEPRALAAAGFEVVALDLSPAAIEIARTFELPPEGLAGFWDPAVLRPGGNVDFVVADMLDPAVCPGPFDVIIERRTAQLYFDRDIGTVLKKLADRLDRNGIFVSHSHDGGWRPPAIPRHFTEAWFEENGWTIWKEAPNLKPTGRVAWLFTSTG